VDARRTAEEEHAMSGSIQALRRANPRARDGFAATVEATAEALSARLADTAADVPVHVLADVPGPVPADVSAHVPVDVPVHVSGDVPAHVSVDVPVETGSPGRTPGRSAPRRRLVRASTVGTLAAAAVAVAVFLTIGGPGAGPGVANAAAAVRKAATVTAAAAERSGTAVVRIDHDGELWAGTTVRWHGQDMAKEDMAAPRDVARRPGKVGSRFLLVDGTMYGVDPEDGGWVVLGSPDSIDPDSGTTPDEYLAAVREDVGGATLRRITDGMTGPTTRRLDDGSTVYSGSVAAGLIARETGFKEGQSIRVFPFGYVAHDEAADPAAPLNAAVTVGADGIVREIAVTWGAGASRWLYKVTYSGLDATPAPTAPANAKPLRRALRDEARTATGGSR
jgi:hypothetical protein